MATMKFNISKLPIEGYSKRTLQRILSIQSRELAANQESIHEGFTLIAKSYFYPVTYENGIYTFDPSHDGAIGTEYYIDIMQNSFKNSVENYQKFVEDTAILHSEKMLDCLYSVSDGKISTDRTFDARDKFSSREEREAHLKKVDSMLTSFDKLANDKDCKIIVDNYGGVISWSLYKGHFNKEKFARQVRADMNCDQDALEMQKRYIVSTLRKDTNYQDNCNYAHRFLTLFQHNKEQTLTEMEKEQEAEKLIREIKNTL
jgi:hypothetical protein